MQLHDDWTAKDYLDHVKELDDTINGKLKQLSEMRSRSTSTGSFDYSKDRVQTSPSGDAPYVRMVDRIYDLELEIDELTDEYVDEKNATDYLIRSTLVHEDYYLFTLRWYDRLSWTEISERTGIGERTLMRRYKRIMRQLEATIYWGTETV